MDHGDGEEPTYSSPQEAVLSWKHKRASLERRRKRSLEVQHSSLMDLDTIALLSPEEEKEEYALVADHVHKQLFSNSLPRGAPPPHGTRSPSFSPPPPPDSPADQTALLQHNGVAVGGASPQDVYASIEKPRPKPKPRRTGSGHNRHAMPGRPAPGYDHLLPREEEEEEEEEEEPRPKGWLVRGASLDEVDDHTYSTVVKPKTVHRRIASAEILRMQSPEDTRSTVSKPMRHVAPPTAPDDLYSLPNPQPKRRPAVPPKPQKSDRKRSTTPTNVAARVKGQLFHYLPFCVVGG